jgi:putative addiction module component (TIGR02574 family)
MSTETLKKEALELSEQQRAQLAHFLIDSLSPAPEFESKEVFEKEIKRRTQQIEAGKVQPISRQEFEEHVSQ